MKIAGFGLSLLVLSLLAGLFGFWRGMAQQEPWISELRAQVIGARLSDASEVAFRDQLEEILWTIDGMNESEGTTTACPVNPTMAKAVFGANNGNLFPITRIQQQRWRIIGWVFIGNWGGGSLNIDQSGMIVKIPEDKGTWQWTPAKFNNGVGATIIGCKAAP